MAWLMALVPAALCAPAPVGRAIEVAATANELLAAATRIEPPGPPFAKPHLEQDVHQIKRQQLASNALSRLGKLLIGTGARRERYEALRDSRLVQLISCAAAPSHERCDGADEAMDAQSARCLARSLESFATFCAADAADLAGADRETLEPLRAGALLLASRAEALSGSFKLSEGLACRWASRRLLGTSFPTPRLDELARTVPFDVLPACVALPPADGTDADVALSHALLPSMASLLPELRVAALRESVPFAQAELLTSDGRRVRERRHTAWVAEEGIGALAYSGKLMNPAPLEQCEALVRLRDALAEDTGERFDCALCNLYVAGGKAACAWHRDPEHGDVIDGARWARPTYVLSAGETRRFAFRPFRDEQHHDEYRDGAAGGGEDERPVVALFAGDVVAMYDDCNEAFEHSVLAGQGAANEGARVSIVFKRALVGRDGKKGHTLAGQGRRARARAKAAAVGAETAGTGARAAAGSPPHRGKAPTAGGRAGRSGLSKGKKPGRGSAGPGRARGGSRAGRGAKRAP